MNLFLDACGTLDPWTIVVEGPAANLRPETLAFDRPFVVVGQAAAADLCLPHNDVSERHALLQWLGGRLRVLDLGSRTGVLYDGRRERAGWLEPGQTIRIGPYRIGLPNAPAGTGLETGVLPALVLNIQLRGIRSLTSQAAGDLAVVGSAADCDVRLLDPAVSNYHCAIVNSPRGSWVVDLLGKGGITVNADSVRFAALAEGDELLIGRSSITIARIEWPAKGRHGEGGAATDPPETDMDSATEPAGVPSPQTWADPNSIDPEPLPDQPEPSFTAESATPADRTPEPRRSGFFAPWRRVPLPNRPAPALAAPIETHNEPEPVVQPARSWTATAPGDAELSESAAPVPRWNDTDGPARGYASASRHEADGLSASERRMSCRYPVSGRTARLHWSENQQSGDFGPAKDATPANGLGSRGIAAQSHLGELNGGDRPQNPGIAVTLVDISHAGLAVLSPVVPPPGEPLWLRLDEGPALDWVELASVGSAPAGGGRHLVRCAFRSSCPYDLFKTLVFSGGPARV